MKATGLGIGMIVAMSAAMHAKAEDYRATGWRVEALDYIIQENPASIREAMWTRDRSLWVSMDDDGSKRDGFAEYLCVELMGNGMQSGDFVVIRIWSHQEMLRDNLEEIGRFDCA